MLRILISGMYPQENMGIFSGTMRVVANLSQALSDLENTDVTLLTPFRFREIFKIHKKIKKGNLTILRFHYLYIIKIMKSLKKFDVINVHSVSLYNLLIAYPFYQRHAKVVYTAHGLIPLEKKFGYRYSRLKQWIEKQLVNKSDFIATVSEQTKKLIMDTYFVPDDKITVINNGVDINTFHPVKGSQYKTVNKIVQILFVGTIVPIKGLEFLFNSLNQLNHLKFVLKMVGRKTPYLSELINSYTTLFVGKKVQYIGPMDQEKLIQCYSETDFVVLTSQYDQYPQVVLEAFAMHKPVIISDRVGAKSLITGEKEGFIIPYGDIDLLAAKMKILAENKKMRLKMGENARLKAEKNTWSDIAKQYSDYFSIIHS